LELFVVEYLPTPELGLFAAELLIGIICVGIFTNARVGIIHGVIGIIYDGIFYRRQSWKYSRSNIH
jgi:hypothetical protein